MEVRAFGRTPSIRHVHHGPLASQKKIGVFVKPRHCSKSRSPDRFCTEAEAEVSVVEGAVAWQENECSKKYCTTRGELHKVLNSSICTALSSDI